jgi:hypothetical protein
MMRRRENLLYGRELRLNNRFVYPSLADAVDRKRKLGQVTADHGD